MMWRARRTLGVLGAAVAVVVLLAGVLPVHADSPTAFFPTDTHTLAIFEFNGNVQDSSGNHRDATLLNPSSTYTTSVYGQGLVLPDEDGVSQGIDWSAYKNLLVPPYTVEALIYPQDISGWSRLFTQDVGYDGGLYYYDGHLVNYPDDPLEGESLPVNTLHCLAWSAPVSPANKLNLYLNGQFLGQVNRTYNEPSVAHFFMDDNVHPNENVHGYVDAMRISDTERTPTELAADCHAASNGEALPPADDGDGVAAAVENAGPNGGDANGDGTLDSDQANVTSLANPVVGGNAYVALAASGEDCTGLSAVSQRSASDYGTDPGVTYPVGLTAFTLSCAAAGDTAHVTMYYDKQYDVTSWTAKKYLNGRFVRIPGASFGTATVGSKQVTTLSYSLTDGGPLDADGEANGTIVDPAGPAVASMLGAPDTGLRQGNTMRTTVALAAGMALLLGTIVVTRFNRK